MPTLTSTEILLDVIQSFKKRFPALNRMGTDFRADALKLHKQYIAHIPALPTVATYDAAQGGYKNGAQAARSLLTDVPITVDTHRHVPIKWAHLDLLKDQKSRYDEVIGNAGYVLAKAVIDDLLAGVTAANFSGRSVCAVADADFDMLIGATGDMNARGALPNGRVMLVSTAAANTLSADSRLSSRDYAGQQPGAEGYRRWTGVGGFAEVIEYPDLPDNGEHLAAFAFDMRAFALLAGIPDSDSTALAGQLNIPQVMGFEAVTDPDSGITMAAVSWQEQGTGDLYWSPTLCWGKALGRQGGAPGALTDHAGHRITTA